MKMMAMSTATIDSHGHPWIVLAVESVNGRNRAPSSFVLLLGGLRRVFPLLLSQLLGKLIVQARVGGLKQGVLGDAQVGLKDGSQVVGGAERVAGRGAVVGGGEVDGRHVEGGGGILDEAQSRPLVLAEHHEIVNEILHPVHQILVRMQRSQAVLVRSRIRLRLLHRSPHLAPPRSSLGSHGDGDSDALRSLAPALKLGDDGHVMKEKVNP